MTINKPLNSKKQPRVVANLQLDTLRLGLSDLQFRKSVTGARNVIMLRKARQYWKARLSVQVSGEARRRWQYAINCTLDLVYFRRKANTWPSLLTSARDNVQYVEAFMVLLEKPTMISEEHKVITEAQDMLRSEK